MVASYHAKDKGPEKVDLVENVIVGLCAVAGLGLIGLAAAPVVREEMMRASEDADGPREAAQPPEKTEDRKGSAWSFDGRPDSLLRHEAIYKGIAKIRYNTLPLREFPVLSPPIDFRMRQNDVWCDLSWTHLGGNMVRLFYKDDHIDLTVHDRIWVCVLVDGFYLKLRKHPRFPKFMLFCFQSTTTWNDQRISHVYRDTQCNRTLAFPRVSVEELRDLVNGRTFGA